MKDEFQSYLHNLQVTSVVISRVASFISLFTELVPGEFSGIFISDFITQDGNMQFDTLYLFSDKFIFQVRNFLQMENFEFGCYTRGILAIEIQEQDYDFQKTSEKSRLTILVKLMGGDRYYQLKASKENCAQLKSIYRTYFLPNIVDLSTPDKVIILKE